MTVPALKEKPPRSVVKLVNEVGLEEAARTLGSSKPTLSRYLRALGYRIKRTYVREEVRPSQN